jgi:hypothetical protein
VILYEGGRFSTKGRRHSIRRFSTLRRGSCLYQREQPSTRGGRLSTRGGRLFRPLIVTRGTKEDDSPVKSTSDLSTTGRFETTSLNLSLVSRTSQEPIVNRSILLDLLGLVAS